MGGGVFTQTRLGNRITVDGGVTLDETTGTFQPPTSRTLLLEASLKELCRELSPQELGTSGPWVFLVESSVADNDWPVPSGPFVVPLKIAFSMGSGGAVHELECDAFPHAAIQVPTATCRVEVFWDRLPPCSLGGPNWTIPNHVTVKGTLQRANVKPIAHRSFLLPAEGLPVVTIFGLAVPRFARTVNIYSWFQGGSPFAAAAVLEFFTGVPGSPVSSYTGPQLLTAMVTGARFPVPAMVNNWVYTYGGGLVSPVFLDFGLEF